MFIPNKVPIAAVKPIASVPQKVIRIIAFLILEPPIFADVIPKTIKNNIAKIYCK